MKKSKTIEIELNLECLILLELLQGVNNYIHFNDEEIHDKLDEFIDYLHTKTNLPKYFDGDILEEKYKAVFKIK